MASRGYSGATRLVSHVRSRGPTPRTYPKVASRALTILSQRPLKVEQRTRQTPPIALAQNTTRRHSSSEEKANLMKTALHDMHVQAGAKMVPFGGYSMPLQYDDQSIKESHLWTREKASLFDVGHMVQHTMSGPGAESFLQQITPSALSNLSPSESTLSVFLHPGTGGIVDDTVIQRISSSRAGLPQDSFYFVTNAANREKDKMFVAKQLEHFRAGGGAEVEWHIRDYGLIALQGPLAAQILESVIVEPKEKLEGLKFGQGRAAEIRTNSGRRSGEVWITRAGYTGEDGFEISVPQDEIVSIVQMLMDIGGPARLRWAGLGARDSLRLEAGLCLYGHDIDDSTTPVEGGLGWVVAKDRRATGGFNGAEVITQQLKPKSEGGGPDRRRIGLINDGPPAREGAEIVSLEGEPLGKVTSGGPSPSLGKNIAMGYVKKGFTATGTDVKVTIRGKSHKATLTKMPFLPSKYVK